MLASILCQFAGAKGGIGKRFFVALHCAHALGLFDYTLPVLRGLRQAQEQCLQCFLVRSLRVCLNVPRGPDMRVAIAEAWELPIGILQWRTSALPMPCGTLSATSTPGQNPPAHRVQRVPVLHRYWNCTAIFRLKTCCACSASVAPSSAIGLSHHPWPQAKEEKSASSRS